MRFLAFAISIIAVLLYAIIVLPGYMESPVRSKTSRARSDMRMLAAAVGSYFVDHEMSPPSMPLGSDGLRTLSHRITTPVGYIIALPLDWWAPAEAENRGYGFFATEKGWMLFSAGPDQDYDITDPARIYDDETSQPSMLLIGGAWTYDPTNGAQSSGDVWQVKE